MCDLCQKMVGRWAYPPVWRSDEIILCPKKLVQERAWTKISLDKRRFIAIKECGQVCHGTVSSFSGLLSFLFILLHKHKKGNIFLSMMDGNLQLSFNTIPSQGYLQFSRKALKAANHLGPKMRKYTSNYGKMRKR